MNFKKIAIWLITFYQNYLSFDRGVLAIFAPGGACKFEISCSEYTKKQIREVGVVRAFWLGVKRIWRCR